MENALSVDLKGMLMMTKHKGPRYKVIRFFERKKNMVIATGLTLEEAKAHCNDPEYSSSTATGFEATLLTKNFGPWFDGYEEEKE